MKRISISNARGRLAELIEEVAFGKEWIEITRRGRVLAVVIPPEDQAILQRLEDDGDRSVALKAREGLRKSGAVSMEQVIPKAVLERSRRRHGPKS